MKALQKYRKLLLQDLSSQISNLYIAIKGSSMGLPFIFWEYRAFPFILIVCLFLLSDIIHPQQENSVWGFKKPDYNLHTHEVKKEYTYSFDSPADFLTIPVIYTYWFAISEPDGDNCPFYPSCSSFLVEGIQSYGFFRGSLLFWDRFTRDTNFTNRKKKYPILHEHKYLDLPQLYLGEPPLYGFSSLEEYHLYLELKQ